MTKLRIQAVLLALVMAPMAAHASEAARPNPKLPEAAAAAPLVPKATAPEAGMNYACMLGQAGGAALSLMMGSGRVWDTLTDAALGRPPSAEQRALCTLGEALAPHVAAAAEGVAEELWASTQRQAEAAKDMMAGGSAQMQQAWAGFLDATAEKSASAGGDLARLCEGSTSCVWLRDTTANAWARLSPSR
ncbi:MAG: hypothetical protein ING03_05200 [Roseomonas sp.]|nr:hypothetical protein [Roseomonas sp.]MCA3316724.1 hypothetical protein [Roseomonas sp.]MCA3321527.1 hypothetical protein [Roseomonas sp.]